MAPTAFNGILAVVRQCLRTSGRVGIINTLPPQGRERQLRGKSGSLNEGLDGGTLITKGIVAAMAAAP